MEHNEIRSRKAELTNIIEGLMNKLNTAQNNKEFMELMDNMQKAKIEYNKLTELEQVEYNKNAPEEFFKDIKEPEKHM